MWHAAAMSVLIVGGAGFVGRHVVRRLLARGLDVTVLDRRLPVESLPGERVVVGDVTAPGAFAELAAACGRVDSIVWLAASIRQSRDVSVAAVDDLELMVAAPLRFLRALSPTLDALVYVSSIEVYGRPTSLPIDEDHQVEPFTAYGAAKLCAEDCLAAVCRGLGLRWVALRAAFIYGPGQHVSNVIPRFLAAVKKGEPPMVFGDGSDVRDDVYVDDVAQAVELSLTGKDAGVFNVASGAPHALLDVARAACALGGGSLEPRLIPAQSTWVSRHFDIRRIRERLGYTPTPFQHGLAAMWQVEAGS